MCTLIVAFYPQSKTPLIIGANRDENPTRPSKPWEFRKGVYSPLDVRGDEENGTWIGTNIRGMFCAITNWDLPDIKTYLRGKNGFRSRGNIVYDTLLRPDVNEALDLWGTLKAEHYRPFNVVLGTRHSLFHLSCDNKDIYIRRLKTGLHISTGEGFNTETTRTKHIDYDLTESFGEFGSFKQPINPHSVKCVLSHHNKGIGSDDSVCVHDDEHRWETRSSSLIVMGRYKMDVQYIDGPPCKANFHEWNKESFIFDDEFTE